MPTSALNPPLTFFLILILSSGAVLCRLTERIPRFRLGSRTIITAKLARNTAVASAALIGIAAIIAILITRKSAVNVLIIALALLTLASVTRAKWKSTPVLRNLDNKKAISWYAVVVFIAVMANNLLPLTTQATEQYRLLNSQTVADLLSDDMPYALLALAAVGLFITRTRKQAAARLGFADHSTKDLILWTLVALALAYIVGHVGGFINTYLFFRFEPASCQAQQIAIGNNIGGTGATQLTILAMCVIPGIAEELLFRGALQPRTGMLIPAIISAFNHTTATCNGFPTTIMLYLFGLNIIWGVMRKYGGLFPSIVLHSAYNINVMLGIP